MTLPILSMEVKGERDIVRARQLARALAERLQLETQAQSYLSTAVAEIARNAYKHAGGGTVEFLLDDKSLPQLLVTRIIDSGRGISNTEELLRGDCPSAVGINCTRKLIDQFHIESAPGQGTQVLFGKSLPRAALRLSEQELSAIAREIETTADGESLSEFARCNRELLGVLEEQCRRQQELSQLSQELEDTNRGVVALYAELDEKAEQLRRADEIKTRFFSNMSHEFRTPVNSIIALSRLLIDRLDGDLTAEQEKQVSFIQKAALDLQELVNDLLDLAKAEAGKIEVKPADFSVEKLFGALRGLLKPLQLRSEVALVFEEAPDIPALHSDEHKLSQILRNFISNALKYTERGEVRVSASYAPAQNTVTFFVSDTGIGIAPEDQEKIFQEFVQIENPLQRHYKGTGLGLSLTRKLAELLGGSVGVRSEPGVGSTFSITIPRQYTKAEPAHKRTERTESKTPSSRSHLPILVVEDHEETLFIYEKYLQEIGYQLQSATTLKEARAWLAHNRPAAIILDILLPDGESWDLLTDLKSNDKTRDIPVIVISIVEAEEKVLALGANDYCVKPVDRNWLINKLNKLTGQSPLDKVLIIDDEEISRYLLKGLITSVTRCDIIEAAEGREGIEKAQRERPSLIFLDLVMPGLSGFEVLDRLKSTAETRDIPVIINTSKVLEAEEYAQLRRSALTILSKESSSQVAAINEIKEALAKIGLIE